MEPVREARRIMGTEAEMLVDAPSRAAARRALHGAWAYLARIERDLSRFHPGSEIARLDRVRAMRVSPETMGVVRAALDARLRTGGRFDPTMGRGMAAIGYPGASPAAGAVVPGGEVVCDTRTGWIRLGPAVSLDLGGIAKGCAADRACALLAAAGPALVSVGGDMAVSGPRRDGGPWPVAVGGDGVTLALGAGGLATSGTDRRRWVHAGEEVHHVLDPATGRPSRTDLLRVTASGASAADAEVNATDLLLRGAGGAAARADVLGIAAVLVTRGGDVHVAGALAGET